jgi:hypothetical protein
MRDPQTVHTGHQRLTFNVRTIPVDWGKRGTFDVRVALAQLSNPQVAQPPIVGDIRLIPVRP